MIKWLVPNQKISKETNKFFEDLGKLVKQSQGIDVEYERLNNDLPAIEQISKNSAAITLVSNYEAMYLESFYEFTPLFKVAITDIKGLVVVHKDSRARQLIDLHGQSVILQQCTDWMVVNPVILFLLKKCNVIKSEQTKAYAAKLEPLSLFQVIEKKSKAAVTTSFEYKLVPEKEQKSLKILGEFPILPEYVVVSGPDFKSQNITKLRSSLDRWRSKYADRYKSLGMQILPFESENRSLLVEAIEGLGYTLNKFVEEYNDLLVGSISASHKKELEEMEEKYARLKNFNDKLVKMYQEVRDSRDRLTKEIESATDNTILFLKDGTVLGCSRAFCTLLKYGRQEIVGQEITKFIETNINTPFKKLIQQIDVGLVRSFVLKLKSSDGTENKAKMEFSIVELMDSKIILGILSNLEKS
ncbi:MAG: PAS domain-containing protein [Candidatus Marinimicrobia bacterium]|nr:PAS domain-containing protein [Candidatus Neomarinimicrobiota bacterium]